MEISVLIDSPSSRTFSSAAPLHEAEPASEERDVMLVRLLWWTRFHSRVFPLLLSSPSLASRDARTAQTLQSATFTMVARDRATRKAAEVNRLVPQTDDEKAIFDKGAARKRQRQVRREGSVGVRPQSPPFSAHLFLSFASFLRRCRSVHWPGCRRTRKSA